MAVTFSFVQGDSKPYFAVRIKRKKDATDLVLTGSTVTFSLRNANSKTAKVTDGACTVTDAALGKVEYRWAAGDTDVPGTYIAEFKVTFSDGKVQRVQIEDVQIVEKVA